MAALPTSRDGERPKSRTSCVIAAARLSEQTMTPPVVMVSFLHYRWGGHGHGPLPCCQDRPV